MRVGNYALKKSSLHNSFSRIGFDVQAIEKNNYDRYRIDLRTEREPEGKLSPKII